MVVAVLGEDAAAVVARVFASQINGRARETADDRRVDGAGDGLALADSSGVCRRVGLSSSEPGLAVLDRQPAQVLARA